MVIDSSLSVLPSVRKDFLISVTSLNMMIMMMTMTRFNLASAHNGHLRKNGIFTWFGIETAKRRSHTIESKIA